MKNEQRSLYIHVPFCISKCLYCDFYSLVARQPDIVDYLASLHTEIALKGRVWGGRNNTLYVGGGTPSCLSIEQLAAVLDECGRYFSWSDTAEITLEINPGSVPSQYVQGLRKLGFNRLSIGLQALQDELLHTLGRAHDLSDFLDLYKEATRAGFSNISVDVMFGLPGQSIEDYLQTLKTLVELGVPHISAYGLQLEPGTKLELMHRSGQVELPPEDSVVEMMLLGRNLLVDKGYVHYEISNFALPGLYSRHNMVYWRNREYIGFGPGAASFVHGRRFSNAPDLPLYNRELTAGRLPVVSCEQLEDASHRSETAILALRLLEEGIDRQDYLKRFGYDPVVEYHDALCEWRNKGMLTIDQQRVRLTGAGMLWVNQVQASLLPSS